MVHLYDTIFSTTIQPLKLCFLKLFKYMEKFVQHDISFSLMSQNGLNRLMTFFTKEIILYRHISKLDEINMSAGGIVILFPSLGFNYLNY